MYVCGAVASATFHVELLLRDRARVADVAIYVGMRAIQRKLRTLEVIEHRYTPRLVRMAVGALRTKAS